MRTNHFMFCMLHLGELRTKADRMQLGKKSFRCRIQLGEEEEEEVY